MYRNGDFFEKKSHKAKKLKGGPFGLVRYCMLRGKLFWFSSLGQRVQFGVFLKFCRTFGVELFWSLRNFGVSNRKFFKKHRRKAMNKVDAFLEKSAD